MTTPVETLATLTVGSVESVSPDEIRVILDLHAPQAIALNTGVPSGFPRINSYVLIPNESGALVGLIIWLGIERSAFPKRPGLKDFDLIDLPFPLRKLALIPVGTLEWRPQDIGPGYEASFKRGVSVFPSVGDPVLVPTAEQLRAIVESGGRTRRVRLGTSPLLANAEIAVDPDRLFGGHLAVLGNTGSGKSCSVAGLVRWSIEAAATHRRGSGLSGGPNARFIILDPNGEYLRTFDDLADGTRVFKVPPAGPGEHDLTVPAWMWNSHEWTAFASASPSVQRPLLLQSLRGLRAGHDGGDPVEVRIRRRFQFVRANLDEKIASGGALYGSFGPAQSTGELFRSISKEADKYVGETHSEIRKALFDASAIAKDTAESRYFDNRGKTGYNVFDEADLERVRDAVVGVLELLPEEVREAGPSEDAPVEFDVRELGDHLEYLASISGAGQAASFVAGLVVRIRNMLADRRLGGVIAPEQSLPFDEWLTRYIGADGSSNGQVAILDLSLVPSDVIHIVVAVVTRVVFEALQRYMRATGVELPTVLVLEEAHTFVQRGMEDGGSVPTAAQMCRHTFERVAREGRKFGLGLVLSSQRPSELSPTVLAQCNTFLLHRLVNDRDQDLVGRLVPDSLGGMLRELPTLPARHAILVGQATPLPLIVEINELPSDHCPRSANPRFWDVWTGAASRPIDWSMISEDWRS